MEALIIGLIEDMKRMQDSVSLQFRIGCEKLERNKEEVEALRKELDQRQDLNEREREMLDNQIKEREMAILEYQKTHENATKLAKEFYREGELRLQRIVQEKASELQVFKDRRANSYMKRAKELDREQFMNALKVKYGSADSEKAEELYSLWEGYLSDPSWNPFQVVMRGEKVEEVIDENDDKLKELKNEFGEEVYDLVAKALNKFNVSYPVLEVWNSSEKAIIKEGVARLLLWFKIQRGSYLSSTRGKMKCSNSLRQSCGY